MATFVQWHEAPISRFRGMDEENPTSETDELIRDFCTRTDQELQTRIWLAAAVIAARGGILTPEIVLTTFATKPTPDNWERLMEEIRELSAPNYLRND
jgi:hypothetical protein